MISEASPDKRAPEPLRLVQQFVNSTDLETGEDELATPAALAGWLARRGLTPISARVTRADLRRALDVREGLRALLAEHNGAAPDRAAVERLEAAAGELPLRARFQPGCPPRLMAARRGAEAGLAGLLAVVVGAEADGSWQRLKACADGGCRWAFYDHSRNRSGRWCSMAVCGNQQKARTFRERHRDGSSPTRKVRAPAPG